MKLRGSKPGHQYTHAGDGPSPVGIILLLCLYLLGSVIGCYLAKGTVGPVCPAEEWLKACACVDGMMIALALLLPKLRMYPLLPLILLPLKGLLTSAWVVWQCTGGTAGIYLRCCAGWGLFSLVSLLCLLVAFVQGMSRRLHAGKHSRSFRASLTLMGILYGFLLMAVMLQNQICKWL